MTRVIEGTIYRLSYTATWHVLVECSSKQALFEYVAEEIVRGHLVTSVAEMCKDGSTPRVKVHTDKEFKKILKARQNPPTVRMVEEYWTNDSGCHYNLSPVDEKDFHIGQFCTDAPTLAKAKKDAAEWIKSVSGKMKVVIVEA